MSDAQIKQCTMKIKAMADVRKLAIDDIDSIITAFHSNLNSEPEHEKPLLADMTIEEKKILAKKEMELNGVHEKEEIDAAAAADGQ